MEMKSVGMGQDGRDLSLHAGLFLLHAVRNYSKLGISLEVDKMTTFHSLENWQSNLCVETAGTVWHDCCLSN